MGNGVQELGDLLFGDDPPGGVVGAAEVHEPDIPVVVPDRRDGGGDVLPVIGEQGDLDLVGLEGGDVLVQHVVGHLGAHDLLVVHQESGTGHVEDFARARAQHDVFRRHAMMLGDRGDDVAVGIAVPVGVLEGVGHRLEDRVGGPVGILVAGELGHPVVLVHAQPGPRGGPLGEEGSRGPEGEIPEQGGDAADEAPPRYLELHVHTRLLMA